MLISLTSPSLVPTSPLLPVRNAAVHMTWILKRSSTRLIVDLCSAMRNVILWVTWQASHQLVSGLSVISLTSFDVYFSQGYEYVETNYRDCCGKCVQTHCIVNDKGVDHILKVKSNVKGSVALRCGIFMLNGT